MIDKDLDDDDELRKRFLPHLIPGYVEDQTWNQEMRYGLCVGWHVVNFDLLEKIYEENSDKDKKWESFGYQTGGVCCGSMYLLATHVDMNERFRNFAGKLAYWLSDYRKFDPFEDQKDKISREYDTWYPSIMELYGIESQSEYYFTRSLYHSHPIQNEYVQDVWKARVNEAFYPFDFSEKNLKLCTDGKKTREEILEPFSRFEQISNEAIFCIISDNSD